MVLVLRSAVLVLEHIGLGLAKLVLFTPVLTSGPQTRWVKKMEVAMEKRGKEPHTLNAPERHTHRLNFRLKVRRKERKIALK